MRLPILRLVLLLAALLPCAANAAGFQPDQQYTNWLNQYRNQVKGQSPKLSTNELEQLAMTLARSNRLVQILPEMLFEAEPDFEHAAELLKEFPGGVNALTRYGQPILHSAIDYNRANTMEFLLQQKANPNVSANNRPVLLEAMQNGRWDMALMLIKAGAVVTVTNSSGENAGGLFFERWYPGNGQMSPGELVPLLLTNGLDVFQATRTGTETAIIEDCLQREQGYRYNGRSGSTPAFSELLLTNNASPIRRTPHGDTALHLAVHNGYTNIIEVLLQNGFTIDQTNSAGLTPLQDLVGAGKANIVISPGAPMPPTPRSAGATNVPSVPQTISAYLL
ncbi:MAG: ankyrin repeat and death protein isoform, partial [Verrucomicrobiota bacterium]